MVSPKTLEIQRRNGGSIITKMVGRVNHAKHDARYRKGINRGNTKGKPNRDKNPEARQVFDSFGL